MEKIIIIIMLVFFNFVWNVNAEEVCFNKVYEYSPEAGVSFDCSGVPHGLILVNSSCTVSNPSGDSCVANYTICCESMTLKTYAPGARIIVLTEDVPVSDRLQKHQEVFDANKDSVFAPACLPGFFSAGGGYYGFSIPSVAASGASGKVDLETYIMADDTCTKTSFSNNTATIVIGGIGSGSGSGGSGGAVDLTATNDLLTQIKAAIIAGDGGSGNQGTIDAVNNIKALLEIGGAANPNALLHSIKGVLDGLGTSGTEGNQLLTDIKTILQNGTGGTGGGTGGTATDMTATNGLLSGITDLMTSVKDTVISVKDSVASLVGSVSGDSSLPGYVDSTLSKSRFVNETMEDIDLFFASDYKSAFSTFQAAAKNTPIFVLINNFFGSVPTGGNSVVSFNGGVFGSHSYDFAKWVGIMSVLKGIILVMFSYACIRILMKR